MVNTDGGTDTAANTRRPAPTLKNPVSDKKRVAYLIDFFGKGGGTENQLAVLLQYLDRQRFHPFLFTLRTIEGSSIPDVGCTVQSLGLTSLGSLKAPEKLWRFARLLRRHRIDILQVFFVDSNIFGVLAGRLGGVRRIVVSRRDMGWWYDSGRLHIANVINRLAHHCLVNAEAVKRVVAQRESFGPSQIRVIANGVPEAVSGDAEEMSREFFGIPKTAPLVGIVSNFKPIKRIDRFLRVAAGLKRRDVHLIILGTGPQEGRLKELASSLGIRKRTHFYYTVDRVAEIVRLMNVGVLTSESEGLSNVLIEYALAGVPAVAFDIGGNREVIGPDVTGLLIEPFNEDQMTAKIDHLLGHPEESMRMGARAAEVSRERFSVDAMVRATERFYEEILAGPDDFKAGSP